MGRIEKQSSVVCLFLLSPPRLRCALDFHAVTLSRSPLDGCIQICKEGKARDVELAVTYKIR